MAEATKDPDDPFKRFKRRDTSDDEDTEASSKRRKWEDEEDEKPKGGGGPPIALLLGIFLGFFGLCGCCGLSGYGLYATGLFSSDSSSGYEMEIFSMTKTRQLSNTQFSYTIRTIGQTDSGYRYYLVFQTGGRKDEVEIRPPAKNGNALVDSKTIPFSHAGITSVWLEKRRGNIVKTVSEVKIIN